MQEISSRVKVWRQKTKEAIVNAMGGKCVCCGYDKCNAALVLHHLDPSQKEFSFGKIRANPSSLKNIINEMKKCVLVCHNCHAEIHYNNLQLPNILPEIEFSYIINVKKTIETDACKICSKQKPVYKKTCSLSCAYKARSKINWSEINLKKELKNKSISELAKKLGCSDTIIRKKLKKLKLK